jgi:hypothetical protein
MSAWLCPRFGGQFCAGCGRRLGCNSATRLNQSGQAHAGREARYAWQLRKFGLRSGAPGAESEHEDMRAVIVPEPPTGKKANPHKFRRSRFFRRRFRLGRGRPADGSRGSGLQVRLESDEPIRAINLETPDGLRASFYLPGELFRSDKSLQTAFIRVHLRFKS